MKSMPVQSWEIPALASNPNEIIAYFEQKFHRLRVLEKSPV
jgi:hypothetical protein